MDMHTYKIIELTGTSADSIEAAVNNALAKASHTVRQMRWFKVVETRGVVEGQGVSQWQVTIKVGFTLEE